MTVTPADRGPQVSAVVGLFLALSTIGIILRCYCRAVVVKAFGLDDWFAVIAWVSYIAADLPIRIKVLTINTDILHFLLRIRYHWRALRNRTACCRPPT